MYSLKQTKTKNKPANQPVKKQRPKPEWTTDFVDRQQFKLSQCEMIQKKAALQSKHRQEARHQLQQRRRKLELGIIDQQTRKIYETALTSKNIDINPPIRKNLTEMIRYEKQIKEKNIENNGEADYNSQNQEDNDEFANSERDIKEAQNFIKKFEKAKKQDKIQRAVQILSKNRPMTTDNQKRTKQFIEPKVNNFAYQISQENQVKRKINNSNASQSFSQDQAISSIEDTIRFMQEKLFAAKKTVQEHSKSFINEADDDQQSFYREDRQYAKYPQKGVQKQLQGQNLKKKQKKQQNCINFKTTLNKFAQEPEQQYELEFGQRMTQISQLRINLKDQNASSDDQCLETIRRMRQMMEDQSFQHEDSKPNYTNSRKLKENFTNNVQSHVNSLECNSTIQKNSHHFNADSEAEVSFNLTVNHDDEYQHQSLDKSLIRNQHKEIKKGVMKKPEIANNKENISKIDIALKTKKQAKEDEYESEYNKIKQNLFNCISNDQKSEDEQEQQESSDSLMVKDRINLWKKQLQRQSDPEDEQEQIIDLKTTAFSKKSMAPSSRTVIKQSEDCQDEQDAYKYTYMSSGKNTKNSQNYEISSQAYGGMQHKKQTSMNRPPTMKKPAPNNSQFQDMKKMISKASSQIKKIQIIPLKIESLNQGGEVLGFDFRGSINIKRNIVTK